MAPGQIQDAHEALGLSGDLTRGAWTRASPFREKGLGLPRPSQPFSTQRNYAALLSRVNRTARQHPRAFRKPRPQPLFGRLIDRHGSHESDKIGPGDGIQPVSGQRHKRPYGVAPVRPFGWEEGIDHAANACRTAAASIFSPASVNRDPLMSPILVNVRSAIGSQKSAETPSANIAIARCSSRSRSFQEIPSISHLSPL
jgi:hypothetical protein